MDVCGPGQSAAATCLDVLGRLRRSRGQGGAQMREATPDIRAWLPTSRDRVYVGSGLQAFVLVQRVSRDCAKEASAG